MPFAMLKVKGWMTMVKKAGMAVIMLLQSMWVDSPIIMAPTSTSTGAVATWGMACGRVQWQHWEQKRGGSSSREVQPGW